MPFVDSHTHCAASVDSEAPLASMLLAAEKRGLAGIAVTDHVELVGFEAEGYDRSNVLSWEMMESARIPEGLRLLRGIEIGEPTADLPLAARLLAAHPYDMVLASQHSLEDTDYYLLDYAHRSDAALEREMERYFEAVLEVVRWDGFDSLAHLTYPFRYMPEKWRNGDYRRWQGVLDELLGRLAQNGKALEINTSGLRKGIGMTSPDRPLIERFYRLGGRYVTLGSDAHRPNEVGANLRDAADLARDIGFRWAVAYVGRRPVRFSLDDGEIAKEDRDIWKNC